MYGRFLKDPLYLAKYHAGGLAIVFSLACAAWFCADADPGVLIWFAPALILLGSVSFGRVLAGCLLAVVTAFHLGKLEAHYLLYLPAAALATLVATMLLHNAAHGNFASKRWERVIGESASLFQLVGFADWVIVHVIHHAHADDPEKDPHPPLNLPFGVFLFGMRDQIAKSLGAAYVSRFGHGARSASNLKKIAVVSRAAHFMKLLFWFALLGPGVFASFFAVSVVMKMAHYAWFNFATHRPTSAGTEIVNLDGRIYRVVNALASGLYYHRNHHLNPKLFDPRRFNPGAEAAKDRAA